VIFRSKLAERRLEIAREKKFLAQVRTASEWRIWALIPDTYELRTWSLNHCMMPPLPLTVTRELARIRVLHPSRFCGDTK